MIVASPSPVLLLLLISPFSLLVRAASPTSFCKCTCGSNSTIIALDPPSLRARDVSLPAQSLRSLFSEPRIQNKSDAEAPLTDEEDNHGKEDGKEEKTPEKGDDKPKYDGKDRKEFRAGNCNDCNRQFCLEYMNLPICKDKVLDEIFTTCFQRDSRKDEAVVFIFIIATAGLLGWAAIKPWVGKWVESAKERRSYIPVADEGEN